MKPTRCNGTNRQGDPCGQAAGWGTDHPGTGNCKHHGGSTSRGRTHAVNEQVKIELARLDVPAVEDPLSELAKITGQVIAFKDQIAAKVNELTSIRYSTETGEQLRAEVGLLERAFDRCERFLTAMARLNIDERLARISEERAELIITVLTIALERAGIEGEQFDTVLTEFDTAFARQAGVSL
jgi:hypothetical protein